MCVRREKREQSGRDATKPTHTHLRRIEDDVELADILKVPVERLDEHLHEVEDAELRLGRVDDHAKVERRVLPVDDARARHVGKV